MHYSTKYGNYAVCQLSDIVACYNADVESDFTSATMHEKMSGVEIFVFCVALHWVSGLSVIVYHTFTAKCLSF